MAAQYLCDGGCGVDITDKSKASERGQLVKLKYCNKCVKAADTAVKQRDELHDSLMAAWKDGIDAIATDFHKGRKNARLAD